MLLQKLVLLGTPRPGRGRGSAVPIGSLGGAGRRRVRLTGGTRSSPSACVIGHWPVLVGYAALPWLVARRPGAGVRRARLPPRLLVAARRSAASARARAWSTAVAVPPSRIRAAGRLARAVALVTRPTRHGWSPGAARRRRGDRPHRYAVFALAGEGSVPGAAGRPDSRRDLEQRGRPRARGPASSGGCPGLLVGVVARRPAAGGGRSARRRGVRRCWGVGWGLAVLTWALPHAVAWLVGARARCRAVPRRRPALALCAPAGRPRRRARRRGAVLGRLRGRASGHRSRVLLAPLALMPDVALGRAGRLTPADYPADYGEARAAVAEARAPGHGDVAAAAVSSYRQPDWNDGHKVLDPLGR